jgi:hypothetical protein
VLQTIKNLAFDNIMFEKASNRYNQRT